jgi:hypothetical protein
MQTAGQGTTLPPHSIDMVGSPAAVLYHGVPAELTSDWMSYAA